MTVRMFYVLLIEWW